MAATVTRNYATTMRKFQGTKEYGNRAAIHMVFETNASGVWVDSNQSTAIGIADVVRLGPILPAGMQILDALFIVSDTFTAAVDFKIGFQYCDGVDVAAVPEDDDYFSANTDAATAARTGMTNMAITPITIPKDCYVIITIGTAAIDEVGRLDVIVEGIMQGID